MISTKLELTPGKILAALLNHDGYDQLKDYTFIILGRPGPTGKTWLRQALKLRGLNAIEITSSIYNLTSYTDDYNHCVIDHDQKNVVVILNRCLSLEDSKKEKEK